MMLVGDQEGMNEAYLVYSNLMETLILLKIVDRSLTNDGNGNCSYFMRMSEFYFCDKWHKANN